MWNWVSQKLTQSMAMVVVLTAFHSAADLNIVKGRDAKMYVCRSFSTVCTSYAACGVITQLYNFEIIFVVLYRGYCMGQSIE